MYFFTLKRLEPNSGCLSVTQRADPLLVAPSRGPVISVGNDLCLALTCPTGFSALCSGLTPHLPCQRSPLPGLWDASQAHDRESRLLRCSILALEEIRWIFSAGRCDLKLILNLNITSNSKCNTLPVHILPCGKRCLVFSGTQISYHFKKVFEIKARSLRVENLSSEQIQAVQLLSSDATTMI